MQDEQLRYSFGDKFKEDLTTYLQGEQLVDSMLPDITDTGDKWLGIAEAYLPDGMRECASYPTVSLGQMMYIGIAIAKYWDGDWGLYSKVENLYTCLRDRIDYDHMDDYICEKVLLLSTEDHKDIAAIVGKYAVRTDSLLRRLPIAPGSSDAFQAYTAALYQTYYMGAAMQLKRMGYHMTKI